MPINYDFLEQNKDQLIQIYVKERYSVNKNEEGVLLIDYRKEDKVDVMYIPVSKMIPPKPKSIYLSHFLKYTWNSPPTNLTF